MKSDLVEFVDLWASKLDGEEKEALLSLLDLTQEILMERKPNDRSKQDRIYAMCITHLQEAAALFDRHVVRGK